MTYVVKKEREGGGVHGRDVDREVTHQFEMHGTATTAAVILMLLPA